MPDLFAALNAASPESLAMQVALLENVSTSNALVPKLKDGLNKSAAVLDRIGKFFGSKKTIEIGADTTDLKTMVQQTYAVRKNDSPVRLINQIRDCCLTRTGLDRESSDTLLSVKVIEEAATFYDISEWLTPAEKAEAIARKHQQESLANLRKMIAKMAPGERAELEKKITQELQELPHEQREAVQRDLKLDSLTGEALMKALLAVGGPLASMAGISAAGFGAYVALTTIIHAVATTVLGITLPFAVYTTATSALSLLTGPVGWIIAGLAMLVTWKFSERKLSRSLFAGLVTSAAEYLPSPSKFVPPSSPQPPSNANNTAQLAADLARSAIEAEAAAQVARTRLAQVTEQLEKTEKATAKAQLEAGLKQNRLTLSNISVEERSRLEADRRNAENLAFREMQRAEEYKDQIVTLTSERDRLAREVAERKSKQDRFEDSEAKKLLDFWKIHFPRITFERKPVKWVVHKRHEDRLSLEKKLIELHGSGDPAALSLGKMRGSGEHHLRFKLNNLECRLYYTVKNGHIYILDVGTNQETH